MIDYPKNEYITRHLQSAIERHKNILRDNDLKFLTRIYSDGLEKYIKRLKAIGMYANNRVLDAGCGFGQWSIALSQLNKSVDCCDSSNNRTSFLEGLASDLKVNNINVTASHLEKLPYKDNTFNAVFCYSVLYLSDPEKSLVELARVLKPGGSLYICSNGIGWYFYTIEKAKNLAPDYDPRKIAMEAIESTLAVLYGFQRKADAHMIIPSREIKNLLKKNGFVDIQHGDEGSLGMKLDGQAPTAPFFPGQYEGFEAVFEILATKNG